MESHIDNQPNNPREQHPDSSLSFRSALRFYRPTDSHFSFTNFSPHGIFAFNQFWRTLEHFFQAQKFRTTDPVWAQVICEAETPLKAAGLGRNIHHPIRPDWDQVRDAVMRYAVGTKFSVHEDLRIQLISTGSSILLLDSPSDSYWGIGPLGAGQNRLGTILMEIREILVSDTPGAGMSRYLEQQRALFDRDERLKAL